MLRCFIWLAISHTFEIMYSWIPDQVEEDIVIEISCRSLQILVPDGNCGGSSKAYIVLTSWRIDYTAYADAEVAQYEDDDDDNDDKSYHDFPIISQ